MTYSVETPLAAIEGFPVVEAERLQSQHGVKTVLDYLYFCEDHEQGALAFELDREHLFKLSVAAGQSSADFFSDAIGSHFEAWPATYVAPKLIARLGLTNMRELYALTYSNKLDDLILLPPGEKAFFEKFFTETAATWPRPTTYTMDRIGDRILAAHQRTALNAISDTKAKADSVAIATPTAEELAQLQEEHEFNEEVRARNKEIRKLKRDRDSKKSAYSEAKKKHEEAVNELSDFIDEQSSGQKKLPFPQETGADAKGKKKKKGGDKVKTEAAKSEPATETWRQLPITAISGVALVKKLEAAGVKTAGDAADWAQDVGPMGGVVITGKIAAIVEMKRIIQEWVAARDDKPEPKPESEQAAPEEAKASA